MFRLDRFLTLFFFRPLNQRRRCFAAKVPILMYHAIASVGHGHRHPYYETSTSPATFAEQLGFLREEGYAIIGLEDLFGLQCSSPRKVAVITFDDGFCDFVQQAFPLLKKAGFPATVFLPAGLMGKELAGRSIMSWDQARTLSRDGISFGSHSITHRKLVDLALSEVEHEIRHSKEILESRLGQPVTSFAYPYAFPEQDGNFLKQYRRMLERSGYRRGVTTIIGTATAQDDRFFLKRLPVNDYDDLRFFAAKIEGAYDWLRFSQRLSKKVRHGIRLF